MCLCVSVLSGSEETEIGMFACGLWALHSRGLHHSRDLSLPHGLALGVGLHPWVNTTLPTLLLQLPLLRFYIITSSEWP